MADTRLTPEDIELLVEAGDITQDNMADLLPDMRDAHIAINAMQKYGQDPMGAESTAAVMGGGLASKLVAPAIGKATGAMKNITSGMGGLKGTAAQMGVDAIGQSLGLPWYITGPISAKVGGMFNKGPVSGPKPAPSRHAAPKKPSNLIRQGNVTNPGPGGTGSPSTPSKGAKTTWNQDPSETPKPSVERRSPGGERFVRPNVSPAAVEGFNKRHDELLDKFGGTKGKAVGVRSPDKAHSGSGLKRQSPTEDFDEADKREVMFGGAGDMSKPKDRGPIKKARVVRRRAK